MNPYDIQKNLYEVGFIINIKKEIIYGNLMKREVYFYTVLWAGESVGFDYEENDIMHWRRIYLTEVKRLGL